MSILGCIGNMIGGATAMVTLVTALPIAGPVGAITVTGAAVSSTVGAGAGAIDYVTKNK